MQLDELAAAGVRDLHIMVASEGGSVMGGLAIYSALRRFPGRTTAHIDEIAASIASVIPAGDVVAYKFARAVAR